MIEIILEEPKHLNIIDSYMNHMNQNRINIGYEIVLMLLKSNAHGREIAKGLDIPLTTVQRSLLELERKNVLDVVIQGKNKVYSLKKNLVARSHIFNAENYKMVKILSHYPELGPVISDVLGKSKSSLIILFGSFAKFSADKSSDIDILIDPPKGMSRIDLVGLGYKLEERLGRKVDLLTYDGLSPYAKPYIEKDLYQIL